MSTKNSANFALCACSVEIQYEQARLQSAESILKHVTEQNTEQKRSDNNKNVLLLLFYESDNSENKHRHYSKDNRDYLR